MTIDISKYFSEEEITCLKEESPKAEERSGLTQPMLSLLRDKKLFSLFVPQIYGGKQQNLPDALKWLEAASAIDGSLGWTLTLGAGAGLFGAFMKPSFAQSVFADNKVLITGSGFPGGKAEVTGDGYTINGRWKYATGIEHATLVTATCYITENGRIRHENGEPVIKAMSFFPDEVDWNLEWKSYGLKATGSYDFTVQNVQIPSRRSFVVAPTETNVQDPLYRYPFEAFAECTLAISLIGMAGHFMAEADELLSSKNNEQVSGSSDLGKHRLKEAQDQLENARKALYSTVEKSWNNVKAGHKLDSHLTDKVSGQSRHSCEQALKSAQQVYPFLGMAVINPSSAINRCWRDLHTASQHMLLTPITSSINK